VDVLLVEDNPADVRLVQELLRPRRSPPLLVHPVGRLGAALGILEQRSFDAVLLDLGLPDSQGLQTLTRFRAAAPQAPVVVTTGLADEAIAEQALRMGAQDYLVKGHWDADRLHRTLRYAMERMHGELSLRSSEQRYRSLFENALEGIFQSTPSGQFLAVNPAFARLLGYSTPVELLAEIGDIGPSLYVPPERRGDLLREVEASGHANDFEACLRRRDGSTLWVRENVRGVRDERGRLLRLEGVVEDVSARRRLERQREAQLAVARVLAEAGSALEAAPRVLGALARLVGFEIGALWLAEQEPATLCCVAVWHPDSPEHARLAQRMRDERLLPGQGLPGEVWSSGRAAWRSHGDREGDLEDACGFPVAGGAGGEPIGVLELARRSGAPCDDELAEVVADSARLLGHILEREQLEAALGRAESRLRHLVAANPSVLYALRVVPGGGLESTWVTENVARLLGDTVEQALAPGWWLSRVHPEDHGRLLASQAEVVATGRAVRDYRVIRSDGSTLWVRDEQRLVKQPLEDLIVGSWTDVTSLKQAELRLGESAQEYRLLFDGNPHPMWVFDEETLAFLAVNDTTVERYGWSRDEFLGMTIRDIRPPDELPALLESVERKRREPGRDSSGPWKHLRRDGTLIDVEVVSSPLRFGGRPARLVLASDVTERKRLEAQLRQAQKMEAVGRLAGGIAHDFNNMLGVVVGFAGLLLRDLPPESRAVARVEQIQKAAERATSLTRQLLAFSRQQVLQPRPVDVNAVVTDLDQMLRRLLGSDVEIVTSLAAGLAPALVDPSQLQQVVLNLVVNARDAMPQGGRILLETASTTLDERYCRPHPEVQPGSYVMLAVSDTGLGMDQATMARIFDPFFTTKPEGQGTGLGLSTVYGIVRQSGGHLTVYSEPGIGSTFRVYLPPAAAPAAADPALTIPTGTGSETLLLVEDGEALRAMLAEVLGEAGYQVLACPDGGEALERAASHPAPIQLLLSDVGLPGLSGPELARRLRQARPGVRVLFMSGYSLAQRDNLAGQAHLQKPFSSEVLLREVRRILDA
jgi:PAS domain S-box-containing protein